MVKSGPKEGMIKEEERKKIAGGVRKEKGKW